jgi:hypothetical protein
MLIVALKPPAGLLFRGFVSGNQTQTRKWSGLISLWLKRSSVLARLGISLSIWTAFLTTTT